VLYNCEVVLSNCEVMLSNGVLRGLDESPRNEVDSFEGMSYSLSRQLTETTLCSILASDWPTRPRTTVANRRTRNTPRNGASSPLPILIFLYTHSLPHGLTSPHSNNPLHQLGETTLRNYPWDTWYRGTKINLEFFCVLRT
jgi:hypothetical protein